jgi:hypothetical protein
VVRAVSPVEASSPNGGSEDHYWQEKEDAGNLKPEDSPDALERAEESSNSSCDAARGLACGLHGGAAVSVWLTDAGRSRRWRVGGGLHAGSYALTRDAPCDAEANAKDPANGLRLHFDLMVTARHRVLRRLEADGSWVARKRHRK